MHPATISTFQVLRELGKGGMGVVYLARDTRLDRQVAIKALPAHLAADPDRLARFQREAKMLASLNHPGIGAIYGLEESGGHQYLILEYVEGETLADRLSRGSIGVEESLELAAQIASALEVAHEKGIVHRDLKPGNVMVTTEGEVKVLDFGLARTEDAPNSTIIASEGSPASPTLTTPMRAHSPTIPGAIMGTAGYMSPEQARGKNVDKRSDIFSFGCVFYEMLTGERPFDGETVTDSLGAILHREPDWSQLPAQTPPRIRELLTSCLVKDRKNRLHDIGDARLAIENADKAWTEGGAAKPATKAWLPWAFAGAACAAVAVAAWFIVQTRESAALPLVRSSIEISPGSLIDDGDGPVALSPDGRTLAFVGGVAGEPARIWIRSLDSLSVQPLQGTDDAAYPFWSPDGKNIGFFSKGKLRRIPAGGGTVTPLADAENPRGASWSIDGTIVFAPQPFGPLKRIAAAGGAATDLTKVANEWITHRLPSFLPDGKRLLYLSSNSTLKSSSCEILLLDLAAGTSTPLIKEISQGLYSPPGYLLFVRNSNLMAQRFDVAKGALIGEAAVLAESVSMNINRYSGAITVSAQGTLVYRPANTLSRLQWFDMEGRPEAKIGEPANFVDIRLSPTGERAAALIRREDGKLDVWICDTVRGSRTKLVEDVVDSGMTWSSDGKRITYSDLKSGGHLREVDGEMKDTVLTEGYVSDWSHDGKLLTLTRQDPKTFMDLYVMDTAGGEPRPYRRTPMGEMFGEFSPDSKWLVYLSDQSGPWEILVGAASGLGATRSVVAGGTFGKFMIWLDDGRLIWSDASGEKLMAASSKASETGIEFDAPKQIFGGRDLPALVFTVQADGKRMLAAVPVAKSKAESLVLVQNWPAALAPSR